jgi:ATP-dependent Clp protease protease subunit
MAAVLLAAGSPKKRFSLPHSRVLIHQPWMSGLQGQATDIDIHAKEILRIRTILNKILAQHTGQTLERIEKDVERDYIMTAAQSKEYGIIDEVIFSHFAIKRGSSLEEKQRRCLTMLVLQQKSE